MRTHRTDGDIEPSTFSPIVEEMLDIVDDGRFTPADDIAADDWAAAVSVFELIAEGKTLQQAVDTFAANSSLDRSRIEAAARSEIASLGLDSVETDNDRAAIELYLALMVETPEDCTD